MTFVRELYYSGLAKESSGEKGDALKLRLASANHPSVGEYPVGGGLTFLPRLPLRRSQITYQHALGMTSTGNAYLAKGRKSRRFGFPITCRSSGYSPIRLLFPMKPRIFRGTNYSPCI
jgi:hypothetical protein